MKVIDVEKLSNQIKCKYEATNLPHFEQVNRCINWGFFH